MRRRRCSSCTKAIPCRCCPAPNCFAARRWSAIHHNGSLYRLHATRQGKLILTK
ncbi:hemin uptake protein HemP [Hydrogenophaga sp. UC242_53]|uniref:hemin uptake protein HemP n=1 Tax=Hydrogenophaga sp. UC242_53 TaxID=3350170 RepID=UPI0036D37BFA